MFFKKVILKDGCNTVKGRMGFTEKLYCSYSGEILQSDFYIFLHEEKK